VDVKLRPVILRERLRCSAIYFPVSAGQKSGENAEILGQSGNGQNNPLCQPGGPCPSRMLRKAFTVGASKKHQASTIS